MRQDLYQATIGSQNNPRPLGGFFKLQNYS